MAHKEITEDAVYSSTGSPMPKDIEQMRNWLLNKPFAQVYRGKRA